MISGQGQILIAICGLGITIFESHINKRSAFGVEVVDREEKLLRREDCW